MSSQELTESAETIDSKQRENVQNKSVQPDKPVQVKVRTPLKEEEEPGIYSIHGDQNAPSSIKGDSSGANVETNLPAKDNVAFKMTKFCIILVVVLWGVDLLLSNLSFSWGDTQTATGQVAEHTVAFRSEHTANVIDLLKYVITACLSFFVGTTAGKK